MFTKLQQNLQRKKAKLSWPTVETTEDPLNRTLKRTLKILNLKEDSITVDPKKDPITKDPKEDPITEAPKEDSTSEDPKENPKEGPYH